MDVGGLSGSGLLFFVFQPTGIVWSSVMPGDLFQIKSLFLIILCSEELVSFRAELDI